MRNVVTTMGLTGLMSCAVASGGGDEGEPGTLRQNIVNGTPVNILPAPPGGHVFVYDWGTTESGSGTLLNNEWVITAAHVVDNAYNNGTPSDILIDLGSQTIPADKIHVHPTYDPNADEYKADVIDVALVHLSTPIAGAAINRKITTRPTFELIDGANTQTRCFGYGPTSPTPLFHNFSDRNNIPAPPLTTAVFEMENAPLFRGDAARWPTGFTGPRNSIGQITYPGDSGGGCFAMTPIGDEELFGVHVAGHQRPCTSNANCTATPTDSCVIPSGGSEGKCAVYLPEFGIREAAHAFRGFARAAMRNGSSTATLSAMGGRDTITLRTDAFDQYVLDFELSDGTLITVPTLVFDTLGVDALAQLEFSDFDGDGIDDMILIAEGQDLLQNRTARFSFLVSSRQLSDGWQTLLQNLFAGTTNLFSFEFDPGGSAAHFNLGPLNDDGFADLVAVQESGGSVRYFGSPDGLQRDFPPRGLDFDGDNLEDLVIASRGYVNDESESRLNIVFGGPYAVRMTVTQSELFGSTGFMGAPFFEYGDFDGSCRPESGELCDDELLVSAYRAPVAGTDDAGTLAYMKYDGVERRLDRTNLLGAPSELGFGRVMGVGDFNGDGFDDVAVGAFTLGDSPSSITILQGGEGGLTENSAVATLHPADFGLVDDPNDWFASELQAGDFNCDGHDDLAIGVSRLVVDGVVDAGAVVIVNGGPSFLNPAEAVMVDKNDLSFGAAADSEEFGGALAAGNYNGDQLAGNPCTDLAIAAPSEAEGGAVYMLYGSSSGIVLSNQQRLVPGTNGIGGSQEAGDLFGFTMAVTRANNDEFDDLVVSAPGTQDGAGAGHVLLGGASGIASSGHEIFRGREAPVPDYLEVDGVEPDHFADRVGGTSDGVVALSSSLQALADFDTDELLGSAGLVVLLQFAENAELLVDEAPNRFGEPAFAVAELSQRFFTVKPSDQGFTEFLSNGGYQIAPYDPVVRLGGFGDILSKPHAGSRRSPARLASNMGVETGPESLLESGRFVVKKAPPWVAASNACVRVRGRLDVRDRGRITSSDLLAGSIEVGADARVTGSARVAGNGKLRSRAIVSGSLSTGGVVALDSTARVEGALQQGTPLSTFALETSSVAAGTTTVTVPNDQTRTLAPGSYGAVLVRARGTLKLSAGTYDFSSFNMEDATLSLDTSGGTIQINVQDALSFGDRAKLSRLGGQSVRFYTNATGTVRIGTDVTTFGASLSAPSGNVVISSRSIVTGCVASGQLTVEPDARVVQP